VHIELTEMLCCPAAHAPDVLVLSTGAMQGRLVRSGVVGCPVCRREYPIVDGVVDFAGAGPGATAGLSTGAARPPAARASALQALLDLSGPGGIVVLIGSAAAHGPALAALMDGIHFVGVNAPPGTRETPALSLLRAAGKIPLRAAMARGVVVGAEAAVAPWLAEAARILLPGRRFVLECEEGAPPGIRRLAAGDGLWVGEKA